MILISEEIPTQVGPAYISGAIFPLRSNEHYFSKTFQLIWQQCFGLLITTFHYSCMCTCTCTYHKRTDTQDAVAGMEVFRMTERDSHQFETKTQYYCFLWVSHLVRRRPKVRIPSNRSIHVDRSNHANIRLELCCGKFPNRAILCNSPTCTKTLLLY